MQSKQKNKNEHSELIDGQQKGNQNCVAIEMGFLPLLTPAVPPYSVTHNSRTMKLATSGAGRRERVPLGQCFFFCR